MDIDLKKYQELFRSKFNSRKKVKQRPLVLFNFKDSGVEIAALACLDNGGYRVMAAQQYRFAEGRGGGRKELEDFIASFLARLGIEDGEAYINIREVNAVFFRNLTMAVLPEDELKGAILWQMKDDIPFESGNVLIKWRVIATVPQEDGTKKNELLAVVMNKETVDHCVSLVSQFGLDPSRVTFDFFCLETVLGGLDQSPTTCGILDVNSEEIVLAFYRNKKLTFLRRFPFTWDKLLKSFSDVLVADDGEFRLTPEQMDNIKTTVGIPLDDRAVLPGGVKAEYLLALLRPVLEVFVRELRFSMDYFEANFEAERPRKIYLTGEAANWKNFDLILKRELGQDVSRLTVAQLKELAVVKERMLDLEPLQWSVGLLASVLPGGEVVNFVPPEVKQNKRSAIQKVSLRYVFAFFLVVVLFSAGRMLMQLKDSQKELAGLRSETAQFSEIVQLTEKTLSRERVINLILNQRVPSLGILKVISTLIPNEIMLESLTYDKDAHAVGVTGIVNASEQESGKLLTGFMERLKASSFFDDIEFVSAKGRGTVQEFELRCRLVTLQ